MWHAVTKTFGDVANLANYKRYASQATMGTAIAGFGVSTRWPYTAPAFFVVANTAALFYTILRHSVVFQTTKHTETTVVNLQKDFLAFYPNMQLTAIPRIPAEYHYADVMLPGGQSEAQMRLSLPPAQESAVAIRGITTAKFLPYAAVVIHVLSMCFGGYLIYNLVHCNKGADQDACYDGIGALFIVLTALLGIAVPLLHYLTAGDLHHWNAALVAARTKIEKNVIGKTKDSSDETKALFDEIETYLSPEEKIILPPGIMPALTKIKELSNRLNTRHVSRIQALSEKLKSATCNNQELKTLLEQILLNIRQMLKNVEIQQRQSLLRLDYLNLSLEPLHQDVHQSIGRVSSQIRNRITHPNSPGSQIPATTLNATLRTLERLIYQMEQPQSSVV